MSMASWRTYVPLEQATRQRIQELQQQKTGNERLILSREQQAELRDSER
jgi:hypothetical protein